jgi:hypothetical protein
MLSVVSEELHQSEHLDTVSEPDMAESMVEAAWIDEQQITPVARMV